MLRIHNPVRIGKALMVTNPVRSYPMARRRRYSRRRHSRRRNPAGSMGISIGRMTEVSDAPVSGFVPKVREVGGVVGTLVGGTLAFVGSNAIGKLVNDLLVKAQLGDKLGGAAGVVKFAAKYIGARAVTGFAFRANKGLLSKDNGRFLLNITIITSGLALLRELGLIDKLPVEIQSYIPQLSAYDAGVRSSNLSRYGRRLRGYDSGIQRSNLSAYDAGVRRASLSSNVNYDNMPVEVMETPTYGVPFGA